MSCPYCGASIALDDVNVATDLALCRACGMTCSFSEDLVGSTGPVPELTVVPGGAWFEELTDGFSIGATTRSWYALFIIPFTCVWSGGSISGIYGSQMKAGHWDLFTSLFGLPFLIGTVVLLAYCAMTVAGFAEVTVHDDRLTLYMGLPGGIGWTRHYLWSDFTSVREGNGTANWNRFNTVLHFQGKRAVSFGLGWSEARRYFVLTTLRRLLQERNRQQARTTNR